MQLVCLSDTHTHYNFEIPDGDVLIHSGDFSYRGRPDEMIDFRDWLVRQPHTHKLFIWGNHEKIQNEELYWREYLEETGAVCLHNVEHTIDGVKFFGSSFTPTFGDWAFMKNITQRRRHWEMAPDGVDVLVTHGPPAGILSYNEGGEDCGCQFLKEYTDRVKPKLHCFGHIHEGAGVETHGTTKFVNASILNRKYELAKEPVIVEI